MIYIFEFDILPGKEEEFWVFMKEEGAAFWTQFDGVEKYEVFTKIGGTPIYEAHVKLKSFESFEKIRKHPDWGKVSKKTSQYAINMQRRFILPETIFE